MTTRPLKQQNLKYEIVDNFLNNEDFNIVVSENDILHRSATKNIFSELSNGKTTVKTLDYSLGLKTPEIVLTSLTSGSIKNKINEFLGIDAKVYSLLDFPHKSGHSYFHRMNPNSFLAFHVDRSYLPGTSMVKVANALLYTTEHWRPIYGGHLFLKHGIIGRELIPIEYRPNRLALIFHTSETFHCVSQLSQEAPMRYSAYMDFYIESDKLKNIKFRNQFWRHETVYLPELKHIGTFLRGTNYSLELINYFFRRKFFD